MPVTNETRINVIITGAHPLYRMGLKLNLSLTKHINVIADAENGSCLLNMLQQMKADVILLDVQMPVMNGITTLSEIKKLYPDTQVIMLSIMNDEFMISRLMELGADKYLTKNSDPEIIRQAIETCYERRCYYKNWPATSSQTSLKN